MHRWSDERGGSPLVVAWRALPPGASRAQRREIAWALIEAEAAELGADSVAGAAGVRIENPCPRCGGPHGPVRVFDRASGAETLRASVAYAAGYAVVALTRAVHARIGVDAEGADAAASGTLDRVLPGADTRAWVRVEAVLKTSGHGLRTDPALVRIEPCPPARSAGPGAVGEPVRWRATTPSGSVTGIDVPGSAPLVIAVALALA